MPITLLFHLAFVTWCTVAWAKESISDYEVFKMSEAKQNDVEAEVEWHKLWQGKREQTRKGNLFKLKNPVGHFSFKEPLNGCKEQPGNIQLPSATARASHCVVATNAGYFDRKKNTCLGKSSGFYLLLNIWSA
jgi:hypothetical protein